MMNAHLTELVKKNHIRDMADDVWDIVSDIRAYRSRYLGHRRPYPNMSSSISRHIVNHVWDIVIHIRGYRQPCPRYRERYPHISTTMSRISSSISTDVVDDIPDIDHDIRGYRFWNGSRLEENDPKINAD